MSFRTRLLSIILIGAMLGMFVWVIRSNRTLGPSPEETAEGAGTAAPSSPQGSLFDIGKTTLHLWYTDEAMTDFINDAAVSFNEESGDYRIQPELRESAEFLEQVNTASVNEDENFPDLYIIGNESLSRAYLAGLASAVQDDTGFADTAKFPQAAIDAVTCDNRIVAYPFYFETAALVYNTDYLQSMADKNGTALEDTVPKTILDIIRLANAYDAPEGVTNVFTWDVNDIFYNYYFVGDTIDLGGPHGDDETEIDLYNVKTIQTLQVYQQLSNFFSIDSSTSNYDQVVQDFCSGKTVFTVATTDLVKSMADAVAGGTFPGSDYGVTALPDITDTLTTRGLSATQCLVVNGYSRQKQAANDFIKYMLYEQNSDFYNRTGRLLAQNGCTYDDPHIEGFFEAYRNSVPLSKLPQTENFWMFLENTLSQVWDGADANASLKSLYEQVEMQISGNDSITVQALPDPEYIDISAELGDEDGGIGTEEDATP